jgi:hypothetical protein
VNGLPSKVNEVPLVSTKPAARLVAGAVEAEASDAVSATVRKAKLLNRVIVVLKVSGMRRK